MLNNEENREEGGGVEPVRKITDATINDERSHIVWLSPMLLRTLDIPSGHPYLLAPCLSPEH